MENHMGILFELCNNLSIETLCTFC